METGQRPKADPTTILFDGAGHQLLDPEDIGLIHKGERYGFWMAAFAGVKWPRIVAPRNRCLLLE